MNIKPKFQLETEQGQVLGKYVYYNTAYRMAETKKLIKRECKTLHEQLEVCYSLIDYFVGIQEAEWAISCNKKEKYPKKA